MALPFISEEISTPPLPSATVMVVRDGPSGLEVLMVRRHGDAGVLGGAHVFPGGKLDPEDAGVEPAWLDLAPQACAERLGEAGLAAGEAVALHVAALRETWEEVGLLLGVDVADAGLSRVAGGGAWCEVVRALGRPLRVSALTPWSRWITPRLPSVSRKRFDTRFFLAPAPVGQTPRHDGHEATESAWLSPRRALERFWAGEIDLAPPQIMSLMELARLPSVVAAQAYAASRTPPLVEPHPFDKDGERVICYPGDPLHPVSQPAWPGPTRLIRRRHRFEPDGGLGALLP
jgi:8-oxo-dGTP pyrophosphatase MutT (NUDIX family)